MNAPVNALGSHAAAPTTSRTSRVLHAKEPGVQSDARVPASVMSGASENEASEKSSAETPEDAYARGLKDGHTAAHQKFEKIVESHKQQAAINERKQREQIQMLATATAAFNQLSREYEKAAETTLERLTLLACGKVLSSLAEENRLASEIVGSVLAQHGKASGLTLHLNQQDFNALSGRLPAGISIAVNSDLQSGEYQVTQSHRQLDVSIQQQYRMLCETLGSEINPDEKTSHHVSDDAVSVGDTHVDT